ncbi:hypothetical protein B296_00008749 [Ensete ventricosum]|uniref:Guanylate-binding protein/Atlastin C-terminal domain-containing protein n=1 Tax=Ensete ventricosum TaxID=4639 RepID=A0A427AP81_ENSVE|nr:hypothetical protein B296_00008749 [Ensete ventricosum]
MVRFFFFSWQGTYSTKIFSLAILLSSLFVYNQLDRLRSEFKSGLDALVKYIFERTRPKRLGATVMTGPILAGITQSYLDAINNGAVPTISSSWQDYASQPFLVMISYDSAAEIYKSYFDRSKPAEEV